MKGADTFKEKINIEVQWATEPVIAAIERNGGVITTTFYDLQCVYAAVNPKRFFQKGKFYSIFQKYFFFNFFENKYFLGDPIPRRLLPPADCLEYYSSAETRGYLADPEKVSQARLALAQKYGYELPKIENDPDYEMLTLRKDPRQLFYGLHPGWVISLRDKLILKPKADYLKEFYAS